jgi:hypothetical protein
MVIQVNPSLSSSLTQTPQQPWLAKAVAKNRHTRAPKSNKNNGAQHKHYKIQQHRQLGRAHDFALQHSPPISP